MKSYVMMKKLSVSDAPVVRTPDANEYKPGENNGDTSVPVEYTITGYLVGDIEVGKGIHVLRDTRNGIRADGFFDTSAVCKIQDKVNGLIITTNNSVYDLEWLPVPNAEKN